MKYFKLNVQESKGIIGWVIEKIKQYTHTVNCCSVTKLCPTLPNYMDCSMPASSVFHYLPKFAQTDVHWWYLTVSSPVTAFSSCPQSFSAESFPVVLELQLQHQSFQWVFRVDFLQDWLVWSPCCPRDSQESSPLLSLLYGPTLTSVHDYWKNLSFDHTDLCWQSDVSGFLICCLDLS